MPTKDPEPHNDRKPKQPEVAYPEDPKELAAAIFRDADRKRGRRPESPKPSTRD